MRSFKISNGPVGVPTSSRYKMWLPPIVVRVQLGSSFYGWTLQTTLVYVVQFSSVNRDVLIANHKKCVSFCNTLACNSSVSTNALTESPMFIGILLVPGVSIPGMLSDMAVLKRLDSLFI